MKITEEQVQKKIEGMVYAVLGEGGQDRKDFINLDESSQDLLVGALIDDLVEGMIVALKGEPEVVTK